MTTPSLPNEHPLRCAEWIWPQGQVNYINCYAHFRKDFQLVSIPDAAPFFITADQAYKLYVNGQLICRGPARGYQEQWPYDEIDLAAVLQAGHNWISIEAYNPGISLFQYIHRDSAGLLCAGRFGEVSIASDLSWDMRRSPGHRIHTTRMSMQLTFQEHVDCECLDRSWVTDASPPEDWNPYAHPASRWTLATGFGAAPWLDLEPRGIPLMREGKVVPEAAVLHAEGECDAGFRDEINVSRNWTADGLADRDWDDASAITQAQTGGWLELTLPATGGGRFRAVAIVMAEEIVGNLVIEVDGASGGEVLDFQYDEVLVDGKPKRIMPDDNSNIVYIANRLRLGPGHNAHEFFHILGFRYVIITARELPQALTVRVRVHTAVYPFTMGGVFESSDEILDDIYSACRRTQQICALDAYVDTPWREQAQWWGDARVQGRNTFYLDGDARLLARGVRNIAGQTVRHGMTACFAPSPGYDSVVPDFSLAWILTVWDHYWQTGTLELFEEFWPRIRQVLDYFDLPQARGADGLLRHDQTFWYFGDWADLYRGETPTFMNLWYVYTVRHVSRILEAAGMSAEAAEMKIMADVHAQRCVASLFDVEKGLMRDGLEADGSDVARWSVHEQTLALMLKLVPEAEEGMITRRILPYLRGDKLHGAVPSAFWSAYTLEEAARRGYGAEVVDFIRRRWRPMLETGTTWEGFDLDAHAIVSTSHAWSSHPSWHLVNILAGITQTGPGWESVRLAPAFLHGVDRVRAIVPSPRGNIEAAWTRQEDEAEVRLSLPDGVSAEVDLPGVSETVVGTTASYRCTIN